MQAHAAAHQLGVSIKALRYYEAANLIHPLRLPNGYRDYTDADLVAVRHIVALTALGLTVEATRPFITCLSQGHTHGDECAESLGMYHREIQRLDTLVAELSVRRALLQDKLDSAARRGFPHDEHSNEHVVYAAPRYGLPDDLPEPKDDGSVDHLTGLQLPNLVFPTTDGLSVRLPQVSDQRWVLFIYPWTGVPGVDMPRGWDEIPGARGCTPEACGFRDNFTTLLNSGVAAVFGLSSQNSNYQRELVSRLSLPYSMLSDEGHRLSAALNLPTFQVEETTLYKRLTLVISGGKIEHVFYPIFPPNEHAVRVLEWINNHPFAQT